MRLHIAAAVLGLMAVPTEAVNATEPERHVAQPVDAPMEPTPNMTAPAHWGTFNLSIENDLFYNRDQHYTNGFRAGWTSNRNAVPHWLADAARALPFFPTTGEMRASFAVGQNMYTPEDITLVDPPPGERPYAGWLYVAAGLVADTGTRLDSVELSLGVVGPWSLAEQTQKFVHSLTGSDEPRGWDTQIENEPALLLTWQRAWRAYYARDVAGLQLDVTPHIGLALGNVFTYGSGGAMLRFGHGLPHDYGPPRIQPSLPGSGFFLPHNGFGWYVFAGLEGRAVAHDIFLDGNTFGGRGTSIDKNILVGDAQLGIAVTLGDVRIAYTHVLRTPEFSEQHGLDNFGAISISTRF